MFNPNTEISQPFLVRGTAILTDAYVAGDIFSMDAHNAIGIEFSFIKGTETSAELKTEISNDGGLVYGQQTTESTSGGTITASLGVRTFSASGVYSLLITPVRARLVRLSTKGTGTVTGSCSIKAYPLWV